MLANFLCRGNLKPFCFPSETNSYTTLNYRTDGTLSTNIYGLHQKL